jgi:indolepyruvate ferredoxin oxidoreductase
MAYKDEYEVARLLSDPAFARRIADEFEGDYVVHYHLAPPLLAGRDPATGRPRKRRYGPWMRPAMALLARLKPLRGTVLDPFGYTAERRAERALVDEYERTMREVAQRLAPGNHAAAVAIARVPDDIRGYGHVKERNLAEAAALRARLFDAYRTTAEAPATEAV